jgi:hypothetical protein
MKQMTMMKMKIKPTLSTIVQKKAILQEKTVMMTDLCILWRFVNLELPVSDFIVFELCYHICI